MITEVVGSIMIIASSTAFGFYMAGKYKKREDDLLDMIAALKILRGEIGFSLTGIPDVFESIGAVGLNDVGSGFGEIAKRLKSHNGESVKQLWRMMLAKKQLEFLDEDIEILKIFGHILGTGDRDQELANIDKTISMLERQHSLAVIEAEKNSRMFKTLGILGGILVVIMLL